MDWNAMSPRERDALVAERVMGWRPIYVEPGALVGAAGELDYYATGSGRGRVPCGWSPTKDIADAWEVVEKIRKDGSLFEIGSRVSDVGGWYAMTMPPDSRSCPECDAPYDWPYSHADTAPEAIALAALRAKGVDV